MFRRQDKIKLYEHHHYMCAFKIKELNKLNSELINSKTTPIILLKDIIDLLGRHNGGNVGHRYPKTLPRCRCSRYGGCWVRRVNEDTSVQAALYLSDYFWQHKTETQKISGGHYNLNCDYPSDN